jgi:hypothetical protein
MFHILLAVESEIFCMPSHYETLQVISSASDAVIKAAYRALAQLYHPDHNPNNADAEMRMKDINHAYQILSNRSSRSQYDYQSGHNSQSNHSLDFSQQPEPDSNSAARSSAPPQASAQADPHDYAETTQSVFHTPYPYAQPPNLLLRLFVFVAAALVSLMAVAKWIVVSDLDMAASLRNETPQLKLRMDKNPLSIPES